MQSNFGGIALVVALAAVGVGTYAVVQERPGNADLEDRLEGLEEQIAQLERDAEARRAEPAAMPSLLGAVPKKLFLTLLILQAQVPLQY